MTTVNLKNFEKFIRECLSLMHCDSDTKFTIPKADAFVRLCLYKVEDLTLGVRFNRLVRTLKVFIEEHSEELIKFFLDSIDEDNYNMDREFTLNEIFSFVRSCLAMDLSTVHEQELNLFTKLNRLFIDLEDYISDNLAEIEYLFSRYLESQRNKDSKCTLNNAENFSSSEHYDMKSKMDALNSEMDSLKRQMYGIDRQMDSLKRLSDSLKLTSI